MALFVGLAILFGAGIWATLGVTKAEEYFAGYLLEQVCLQWVLLLQQRQERFLFFFVKAYAGLMKGV